MKTYQARVVAAAARVDPGLLGGVWESVLGRVAGRFARVEPRRRARRMVAGLVSDLPRKNCWTIAEHAGDASPHGMQQLLRKAVWDAHQVRDDVRAMAVEYLGRDEAILVVDETGDVKKGRHSVGCSVSTPAPRAGSRTLRSPCSSPTPPRPGTPDRPGGLPTGVVDR